MVLSLGTWKALRCVGRRSSGYVCKDAECPSSQELAVLLRTQIGKQTILPRMRKVVEKSAVEGCLTPASGQTVRKREFFFKTP